MAKEGGGDHSGGDNRRVRLTRGRSKGEEINRDRGHLANFLHTPGWSHPSQMKATADKKASAPVAPGPRRPNSIIGRREDKMQQLPCLHSERGRGQVLPQDWEQQASWSSLAECQETTENSRQRIPTHRHRSTRHNMQFPTVCFLGLLTKRNC